MEKRLCSRTPADPSHPDRVVGRTPPKARNLCRTTPTILYLLLFVLLFFLDLLFLLLYVLLLLLQVFLYVLLLFLYVLVAPPGLRYPHNHPGSTPVPGEPLLSKTSSDTPV